MATVKKNASETGFCPQMTSGWDTVSEQYMNNHSKTHTANISYVFQVIARIYIEYI